MQNHSCGYKFHLHVIENLYTYEWFCTQPRFEKEAKSNLEMGYFSAPILSPPQRILGDIGDRKDWVERNINRVEAGERKSIGALHSGGRIYKRLSPWCHFTTTTRIRFVFPFLLKFCNPQWSLNNNQHKLSRKQKTEGFC